MSVYNSLVNTFEMSLVSLKMLRDNDQMSDEAELKNSFEEELNHLLEQLKDFKELDFKYNIIKEVEE